MPYLLGEGSFSRLTPNELRLGRCARSLALLVKTQGFGMTPYAFNFSGRK
jgi:hypothetical protein